MSALDGLLLANAAAWGAAGVVCGRARSQLAWWALAAGVVAVVGLLPGGVPFAVALGTVVAVGSLLSLPTGVLPRRWWPAVTGVALVAGVGLAWPAARFAAIAVGVALGLGGAVNSTRQGSTAQRRRIEVVVIAIVLGVEVALASILVAALFGGSGRVSEILLVSALALPAAGALAVNRSASSWVERVLGLAVVAGGLSLLLGVVVITVLAGLGGRPTGPQREAVLLGIVATAVAGVVFPSVYRRLRTTANRIVYGAVDSPDDVARGFGSRLSRAIPLDELLLQLVETLRRSLRLEAAEVWTGADGTYALAASVPHRSAEPLSLRDEEIDIVARAGPSGGSWIELWIPQLVRGDDPTRVRVTPLTHGGRLLGLIVVRRHADGDPYDDRDEQLLADLSRQVAAALHNVALDNALADSIETLRATNDELRASRSRVVASGDAERRRIERNLHDGAQQHLVALTVKLRLAHDALADGDTADAAVLLDEMRAGLSETIMELRALAHGIYPPLLASGGLAEALPVAASRAALPTIVARCPPSRYNQEVESAVYFCCLEAMQNAAKYAGPTATARIEVGEEEGWLLFTVCDDGVGFAASGTTGQGLTNMADRVGAVGGHLAVESTPGAGTHIRGRLPLSAT